jgi:hypothetical protein
MKYSSRFFLYAPLAVFLVLAVVVGAHWWVKASALSQRLAALNGYEAMPGVTVSFGAKKIGGFPFSLDTELSDFTLTVATPNGPTRWYSEKFAMHALTYGRDETIFEAAGRQRLDWRGHTLDFAVGALRASAILSHGSLARFDLDLVGFGSKAFTAQRLQLHARRDGNAIRLFDEVNGVSACLQDERYAASATAAEALAPLLAARVSVADGLKAWRQAGGKITPAHPSPLGAVAVEEVPDIAALVRAVCSRA